MAGLNPYFLFTVAVIGSAGIPKGYDEGGFSASITLTSFKEDYNLVKANWVGNASGLANRTANIASFGVLGAAFGALGGLWLNDRFGRLRAWRIGALVWAAGLFVQIFASGVLGVLLFARIFSGLGAGMLTVAGPLYLSEIAPAKTRGMWTSVYMVFVLGFLALGFFINYAANAGMEKTRTQYRLVQAIPLIPIGISFGLSFFLTDTPRWLASRDHHEEARVALSRLRNLPLDSPDLRSELADIEAQIRAKAADLANTTFISIARELFTVPSYRRRYLLSTTMHVIAQWTGGNAITYYVSSIFESAGVSSQATSLISSGAYGIVKLVFTIIFAIFFIDYFGRRRCFLSGLTLQLTAHIYLAVYMASKPGSSESKSASDAAIAMIFIYAVGWSIGLCTVPYIYSSEIFPTRVRNVTYASTMGLHWFLQFAVVRAIPPMFVAFHTWGVYVFFALICTIGFVVLGLWAPETKGVGMERMERLFERSWYMGWKVDTSEAEAPAGLLDSDSETGKGPAALVREKKADVDDGDDDVDRRA